ncbi:carbohydrate kinase [Salmonella enterica subsp. enterica serovar Muenchen]|uniref:FGGY-family carbohydrate kinase n=1 Tax=Salmonella enterica TaxID=28901 RepID=UPI001F115E33|nr:FGGY-family carbohydrate kinase [Salmonella enterica]EEJ6214845.1 carbohydrate kinase [Salmonella enterica]MCH5442712.1 carbohydrate kinase [Salmonella enterica subsp. enterica serovar Muenchen]
MNNYFIGIDIGTSNIKSVLFDDNFNELYVASRKNITNHPAENLAEQDMLAVWQTTLETLKEVILCTDINPFHVKGIGITGQGEGLWLIDEYGNPVRPAILWCDSRAAEIVNEVTENTTLMRLIENETGTQPLPCNTSMILSWMTRHEPENLRRAKHILFAKDWIRYKLTGKIGLETSDTGISILDIKKLCLSETVFNNFNLNNQRHLFTNIAKSTEPVSGITQYIATQTGLSPETLVCYGALDVSAAALGMGAINEGDVFTIMGTTCCTGVINSKIKLNQGSSRCIPHALDGLYIDLTATLSGTPNIDWCIKSISTTESFSEIEKQISSIPAGSGGCIYHPYLSGERAPFYNENARANFFGINTTTTRQHLIRSVYEGVAFTIKDALQDYPSNGKIYLSGGGTKSACWSQIISDITGRTVILSSITENAARGAAILAAISSNTININDTNKLFNINKTYLPSHDNTELYTKIFKLYKQFRITNTKLWDMRADIFKSHVNQP